ncbi:hypothetical protein V2J09_014933 [Rumex salicifolius]
MLLLQVYVCIEREAARKGDTFFMNHQPSLQMEDAYEDLPSLYAREEHMVSAAQHIVKLLGTHRHANDHLRQLLVDLDSELTAMKLLEANKAKELNEIRDRLALAEEKIKGWGSNPGMTWESCPDLFSDFLRSVDEVHRLAEYSRTLSSMGKADCEETITKAENLLQIAMTRIEDDLRDIFSHSLQSFLSNMPSPCCEEEVADRGSFVSDDSVLGSSRRESSSSGSEHYVGDLVCADSIPVIKSISRVMYSAKYDKEFCETFIASQKEALDELLADLGIKRFTIEELIKMEWKVLDGKIKTWIRAVRIFVQVYLAGERRLCEQVFEEVGPTMDPAFFANIASPTMTCLLNFGQGVAMGARRPEKLFALLNMVEVLREVSQEVYDLFCQETASSVTCELKELATTLGCSAKATFLEFGDYVHADPSIEPFHAGRIHHLTKYVMNYLNTLPAYHNVVNLLLDGSSVLAIGSGGSLEEEEEESVVNDLDSLKSCLMAVQLRSIVDKLEMNIENKSRLYKDSSLRHIFLLNNIHYIVQKVRDSDLRAYLGDDWTRKRISTYKNHATGYIRTSWSQIVPLILDEGGSGSSSGSSRTAILKEKLRSFASAFEDLYKTQSGWLIRDHQLKQELKISITQTLVPAYQGFVIRCKNLNIEKYIKYEADDVVDLIQDLFEGSVKSLSSSWRR